MTDEDLLLQIEVAVLRLEAAADELAALRRRLRLHELCAIFEDRFEDADAESFGFLWQSYSDAMDALGDAAPSWWKEATNLDCL